MRIGLLGGTFNPIHFGHLHIAEQAREKVRLDQILFIPTGGPPHKSFESLAPAYDRLEMVKLATKDYPHLRVSEIEIFSSETCYTVDTLKKLKNQLEGELYFLLGLDAFLDLPTWKAADELLTQVNFVVISRPKVQFCQLKTLPILPPISKNDLTDLDNEKQSYLEIRTASGSTLILLAVQPYNISASAIRDCLKKGLSAADWLPATIESYIIESQLYGVKKGA